MLVGRLVSLGRLVLNKRLQYLRARDYIFICNQIWLDFEGRLLPSSMLQAVHNSFVMCGIMPINKVSSTILCSELMKTEAITLIKFARE